MYGPKEENKEGVKDQGPEEVGKEPPTGRVSEGPLPGWVRKGPSTWQAEDKTSQG